ncbi:MAG: type II toxin-antitoxin system MqsR family toxin [Candidatus Hydrogenedentes bacterium]|nr:type II toxin-antitoxin system MqsR family toxin [Candidatus Hydrogenedentota bacterium]
MLQNNLVEKKKPHYPLQRVKELIREGSYRVTRTAIRTAARDFRLFKSPQLAGSVLGLTAHDFYKSMTSYDNAKIWQDVYRQEIRGKLAYVKMQIVDETTVIISFKQVEEA